MTCRHKAGDPTCSSSYLYPTNSTPATPDKAEYEITDFVRVGKNIVLKVKYPNCSSCAYEGNKVMVFLDVSEAQLMKWKEIDPHFRDPKRTLSLKAAPSPAARFPASKEGWEDAIEYATKKR